jgi:Tol biopolymer transport system component
VTFKRRKRCDFGRHDAITRTSPHRLSTQVPRILAMLSVVLLGGTFSGPGAHGEALRPRVRIAYVHGGNIWLLVEPSGHRTRLTGDGQDFGPHWIAGGRALLFCRGTGGGCETWRWQPGQAVTRLRDGLWSPDGTKVAFTRIAPRAGSPTTVWIAYQGRVIRMTPNQPRFYWTPLAWSPDSRRLALGRVDIPPATKPGEEIPPTPGSLWVTAGDIGSAHLRRLPLPAFYRPQSGWPDVAFWSPNGRFLTVGVGPDIPCSSCRADGRRFYAIPTSSGTTVSLGTALDEDAISWAPDGSYVVVSDPGGRETYFDKHLVRINPSTGARRVVSDGGKWAAIEPDISPDGTRVAFTRGRTSGPSTRETPIGLIASRHLFVIAANGTGPHQLTRAPGWADEAAVWSPDGAWVQFVRWRRHQRGKPAAAMLWAVRADGSDAQRLASLDVPGGFLNGFGYYGNFGWQALFAVAQ